MQFNLEVLGNYYKPTLLLFYTDIIPLFTNCIKVKLRYKMNSGVENIVLCVSVTFYLKKKSERREQGSRGGEKE